MKAWHDAKGVRAEESWQRACLPLSKNGSLGYARDDGVGRRMSQCACKGLVLIMPLARHSYPALCAP